MFVDCISHDVERGLHACAMEDGESCSHNFEKIKVFGFNHDPLTYTINFSPNIMSLAPTNTAGRMELTNRALTWSSYSCSSTSFRISGTKVGKFNRCWWINLRWDATNSGLIDVNDFSNWFSSSSFLNVNSSSNVGFLDIFQKVFTSMAKSQFFN